jgi:hemolysin activation/secretion protein
VKKEYEKSAAITQIKDPLFNYSRLYDSLKLNTYQLRLRILGAHYFPLGRQSVLKMGVNSGLYESPSYFRNELFQIGGYRLLRGFDEESIFSNRYAVGTLEYRYLLGLNSYFFAFSDLGWSKNSTGQVAYSNKYIGAGLGLSFETKGGLFNISFAAGKRNDIDFNIRQSKIHFGYVSVF